MLRLMDEPKIITGIKTFDLGNRPLSLFRKNKTNLCHASLGLKAFLEIKSPSADKTSRLISELEATIQEEE